MNHSKYPSIGQFRNIIKDVQNNARFVGVDENNEPIFDITKKAPTLTFTGTVKLHGTNFCCAFNSSGEYHFQSRERIITPVSDNIGSAQFGYRNIKMLAELNLFIIQEFNITNSSVYIFGEIAGKGVQKGVGISNIEKSFFIFGVKIIPDDTQDSYWINTTEIQDRMV
jgi:hypothetical protein